MAKPYLVYAEVVRNYMAEAWVHEEYYGEQEARSAFSRVYMYTFSSDEGWEEIEPPEAAWQDPDGNEVLDVAMFARGDETAGVWLIRRPEEA